MESKDKLKEIDIKNRYYFDDIIKDVDIYFSDILLDEKLYENIFLYDISCKTSVSHCVLGSIKQMDLLGFMVVNLNMMVNLDI